MQHVNFSKVKRVLCLGAHSDDIEIGCGGTMLKLTDDCEDVEITWVVFSADGDREKEAKASANAYLRKAGRREVMVKGFRGSYFPYQGEQIKEFFETLKSVRPDVVFVHCGNDRHQDHRLLSELAWSTFRDHLILEYEIPKYDGDLGSPNVFVQLDARTTRRKVRNLSRFFGTQSTKHWFSEEVFLGLMRLRGMECASPTGFAEGFYCRKLVLATS